MENWNAETTTREIAQAQLTSGETRSYNPLLDLVLLTLTNVGFGLGTNALYDLIKAVFEKKGHKQHIHITQLEQPQRAAGLL
ncbi:MAG TPA: hypothetical protein VGD98_05930 [Ktedonobacteraceae bacterium]